MKNYAYYIDADGSVACLECYANDPCEATLYKGSEKAECSRCDEDICPDGYNTADYPETTSPSPIKKGYTLNTYILDKFNKVLCVECAESTYDIMQCTNDTGEVMTCSCCDEDIPYVGQVYVARKPWTASEWEVALAKR